MGSPWVTEGGSGLTSCELAIAKTKVGMSVFEGVWFYEKFGPVKLVAMNGEDFVLHRLALDEYVDEPATEFLLHARRITEMEAVALAAK